MYVTARLKFGLRLVNGDMVEVVCDWDMIEAVCDCGYD